MSGIGSILIVSRISNMDLINRHSSDIVVRTGFEPVKCGYVCFRYSLTKCSVFYPLSLPILCLVRLPIPPPDQLRERTPLCCVYRNSYTFISFLSQGNNTILYYYFNVLIFLIMGQYTNFISLTLFPNSGV